MKDKKRKIIRYLIIIFILFGLIYSISNDNNDIHETVTYLTEHNYDLNKLYKDGEFYHYEDDNYISLVGIDISQHQRDIDFNSVKNAGVDFVVIRLGWRGYSEGKIHLDDRFEEYYEQASEVGLKIGFYFFSQAINEKEAIEEAEFVLRYIKNKKFDLPIVYDYEDASPVGRIAKLNREEKTKNAIAFLERIKRNNYHPMLYTSLYWVRYCYEIEKIMNYDIWFAQYYDYPQYPYPFSIWQYSETGKVDGIETDCDLDIMFIKK